MRKMMMLAAMVAMALLVAAPVMADTVLSSSAEINQSNEGSQFAINQADQDADASQYQYNPGGNAVDDDSVTVDEVDIDFEAGNNLEEIEIDEIDVADETGGAGGTGDQFQYQNQSQDQDATATGPTFDATQTLYSVNMVAV